MDLSALTAISPIDGRYRSQLQHLDYYFSEYALIRYRLPVDAVLIIFASVALVEIHIKLAQRRVKIEKIQMPKAEF